MAAVTKNKQENKHWLDSCYEQTLLPNGPWTAQIRDKLLDGVAVVLNRDLEAKLDEWKQQGFDQDCCKQMVFTLLGYDFINRYFTAEEWKPQILKSMGEGRRLKLEHEVKEWLNSIFKSVLSETNEDKSTEQSRNDIKKLMDRYKQHTREVYKQGLEQELHKLELPAGQRSELDNVDLIDSRFYMDDARMAESKDLKIKNRAARMGKSTLPIGAQSIVIGAALSKLLAHDMSRLEQVVSRLHGCALPCSLREHIWSERLVQAQRERLNNEDITMQSLFERYKRTAELNGIYLDNLDQDFESDMDPTIRNSVYEIYKSSLALQEYSTDVNRQMTTVIDTLNVLYIQRSKYRKDYIHWVLPIILAFSKTTPPELPILKFSLYLDIFITSVWPGWDKIRATADQAMARLETIDPRLYSCITSALRINPHVNRNEFLTCIVNMDQAELSEFLPNVSNSNHESADLLVAEPSVFVRKWLEKLFVGVLGREALMFVWDQCFMQSFNPTVLEHFSLALMLLLEEKLIRADDFNSLQKVFLDEPCKIFTKDLIRAWLHLQKKGNPNDIPAMNRLAGPRIRRNTYTRSVESISPSKSSKKLPQQQQQPQSKSVEYKPVSPLKKTSLPARKTGTDTMETGLNSNETGLYPNETSLYPQETGLDSGETSLYPNEAGLYSMEISSSVNKTSSPVNKTGFPVNRTSFPVNKTSSPSKQEFKEPVSFPVKTGLPLNEEAKLDSAARMPVKKPERRSGLSCTFDVYIDGLTNLPDRASIVKVTARLINSGITSSNSSDVTAYPDLNSSAKSPTFTYRHTYNIARETMGSGAALLLTVYTVTSDTLELVVLGHCAFSLFNQKLEHLRSGCYMRSLRVVSQSDVLYDTNQLIEQALDDLPAIPALRIYFRIKEHTKAFVKATALLDTNYARLDPPLSKSEEKLVNSYIRSRNEGVYCGTITDIITQLQEKEGSPSTDISKLQWMKDRLNTVEGGATLHHIPLDKMIGYNNKSGVTVNIVRAHGLDGGRYVFCTAWAVSSTLLEDNDAWLDNVKPSVTVTRVNLDSLQGAPVFISEPQTIQPITKPQDTDPEHVSDSMFYLVVTLYGIDVVYKPTRNHTSPGRILRASGAELNNLEDLTIGWTILPLTKDGFVCSGEHHVPIFKGRPMRSLLTKLSTRPLMDVIRSVQWNSDNKYPKASVVVDVWDGQLSEEDLSEDLLQRNDDMLVAASCRDACLKAEREILRTKQVIQFMNHAIDRLYSSTIQRAKVKQIERNLFEISLQNIINKLIRKMKKVTPLNQMLFSSELLQDIIKKTPCFYY